MKPAPHGPNDRAIFKGDNSHDCLANAGTVGAIDVQAGYKGTIYLANIGGSSNHSMEITGSFSWRMDIWMISRNQIRSHTPTS